MTFVETILNVGSIAGLISIFSQVHQSRRNRPSFQFTQEGTHSVEDHRDGFLYWDFHMMGLIRNASLNANSIVRLYLVIWKDGKRTQVHRYGHVVRSIVDIPTGSKLNLPLAIEGRDARRVDITFEVRLTNKDGSPSGDGVLMLEMTPFPSSMPGLAMHTHDYEFLFKDAAGNYFDRGGQLISRELIDLNWTLVNYQGWQRLKRRRRIAWAWISWKMAILRSWFGFYR